MMSRGRFRQVTGEAAWPDYPAPWLRDDALEYFCNGRLHYEIRGIHVDLEARWQWQTEAGDDTHAAWYRGSRAPLELRQVAAENYRPQLYVVPQADIPAARRRRIATAQPAF